MGWNWLSGKCKFNNNNNRAMNDRPLTSKYRYTILAMLLYATSVNYFDRSIIAVMAPTLQRLFHWTNRDYADIIISFQTAYALGMLVMGNIIDRLGSRKGYTLLSVFGRYLECFMQPFNRFSALLALLLPVLGWDSENQGVSLLR